MSEHRRKPPQGRGRRAQQPPQPPQAPPGRRAAPPHQPTSRAYGAGPDRMAAPGGYGGQRRGGQDDTMVGGPRPGGRAEARRAAQRGGRRRAAAGGAAAGAAAVGGRAAARERARAAQTSGKKRFIDYPRSGKYGWRRWTPSWKQWLGTVVGFTGVMMGLAGVAYAMVNVPDQNKTATSQQNVYYWANGDRMVTAGGGKNRQNIDLSQMPQALQQAAISAENESFYEDSGIDPSGIARAAFRMAMGGQTQSGSTITQQFVKNNYLTQEQTITRKVKELLISIKVDARMSKDEILEGYFNTAYYGRGSYGIQAASQAYYRKDASELTVSQSAFMTTLLNAPNLYDPYGGEAGGEAQSREKNRARAVERWQWILGRMVETGALEAAEKKRIVGKGFPMPEPPQKEAGLAGQIGYLVELANQDILTNPNSEITEDQLKRGGLQIYTTFQRKKVEALEETIKDVRKENLKPKERKKDKYVQFGGASVKPGDGAIVAVYGGKSATEYFVNNADYTGAGVGSTFKPYVMAAALENGVRDPSLGEVQSEAERIPVTQKTVYDGDNEIALVEYDGDTWLNKDGKEWHQPNEGETNYGPITLREAMEVSANTPFIQLGMDVGLEKVREAAIDAGLNESSLMENPTPSFALGISAPSAIRMATGYATFANGGVKAEPYSVTEVKNGAEVLYEHDKKTAQAFDSDTAATITDMLVNVVEGDRGTGSTAEALGRPVAGKTGTTDENKTAWFTGYTPQLSTSIGMWRSNPEDPGFKPMYGTAGRPQIHGASFPAEIWTTYMTAAMEGKPIEEFPEPPPITGEKYCAHDACPTPTPTPSPSQSKEATPSPSVPTTPSPTAEPSPTETCSEWFGCTDEGTTTGPGGETDGGMDGGTTDGGMDGGTTDGGTSGDPGGSQGNSGGETDGGLFGGPETGTEGRTQEE